MSIPIDIHASINNCFFQAPATKTLAYEIYKSIWIKDRTKWSIKSQLHQNSFDDALHFSMIVEVATGWMHTLHFYGYFKNTFIIDHISASNGAPTRDDFINELVASFD
jgi:hypothetical protein